MDYTTAFTTDSTICGHHVYKEIWTPIIGEELTWAIEDDNNWDPYAVAIIMVGTVVGHIQHRISAAFNLFLEQGQFYAQFVVQDCTLVTYLMVDWMYHANYHLLAPVSW